MSVGENGQVESGETFGVEEEVELDDPAVANGEGPDGERAAVSCRDKANGTVDQRGDDDQVEPRETPSAPGDGDGADPLLVPAATEVGVQHDVGVEHRHDRFE